uniref:Integrase catalytic domain-containing protein n=1 Tax=Tanacetum cinerariifolium TaxID=118510 RepID=A0A699GRR1_TANCI|nr:hypothetical protein [Tanacetum cinerariifolium]
MNIAINELKKFIEKCKGKSMETKFDKPSVVRLPNAQWIPKPSVLGKPAPFSDSLERKYFSKTKSIPKTHVSKGLSKTVTAQTLPQTERQAVSNTNVLKLGMYLTDNRTTQIRAPHSPQTFRNTNPCMSNSTGVNHKTNVSRPQHRSNQMKVKVILNNSQVNLKKTQVEDHPRIPSIYNKIKSVTACNGSLNSRTLNVHVVCATCGKCLVDSDHFACVTKMLNQVNARTKKPNVVPISTKKPKGHADKSVVTPHKKKVASKSTTQKPKSYYRILYEKTSTVCFGNDQFVPILGYGDLVQGNITINRVYYVEGFNRNLFSLGQICDADFEVAFRKSTCFVRDLQGNDLLTVITVRTDKGTEFLNKTLNAFFKEEGIEHQTSTALTPEQNGVVERQNRTLVEATRTMLSDSRLLLFFLVEAIATTSYTQNKSIIISTHKKMAYHIINDKKPSIKHLYIFGCICYLTRDGENLDKIKEKGDPCILVGYSTQSKGYGVYNKRTRLIVESTHIRLDEIKEMSETSVANNTSGLVPKRKKASDYDNSDLIPQL